MRKPNPRVQITRQEARALICAGFGEAQVRAWLYCKTGPYPCDYPAIEAAIEHPLEFVPVDGEDEVVSPPRDLPGVEPVELPKEPAGEGFCWISFDAWAADGLTKEQVCEACVKQLGICRKARSEAVA